MTRSRFVVDTNLIVSGLIFPKSVPRQAVDAAFDHGVVLTSQTVMAELVRTLRRPKLVALISDFEREEFLDRYSERVEPVMINERITECRDPRDDKFLELAVSGNAEAIITGDKDLLSLGTFREITILRAAEFLAQTAASNSSQNGV